MPPMPPQLLSLPHLVRPPRQSPPPSDTGSPRPPLLVLLHGYGSSEEDLFGLAPYADDRFCVVAVRAPLTLGYGSYAWFSLRFSEGGPTGDEEEAEASRRALLHFVEEAVQTYGCDPARVYLAGFSQGAMLALFCALTAPESVAGIVAMSGAIPPLAWNSRAPDDRLRRFAVFIAHGTRDSVVPIAQGRDAKAKLAGLPGVRLTYREYDMAHEVSLESIGDVAAWLSARLDERTGT